MQGWTRRSFCHGDMGTDYSVHGRMGRPAAKFTGWPATLLRNPLVTCRSLRFIEMTVYRGIGLLQFAQP
jgi:hypothetical protein